MRCRFESTPSRLVLAFVLMLSPLLPAASAVADADLAGGSQAAADGSEPQTETKEGAATSAADDAESEAGEDEGWIVVDEQKGTRYRIVKLENKPELYRWVDDTTIRYRHGLYFDVTKYDDDFLWVKEWSIDPEVLRASRKTQEQKAAEEATRIAAIAPSYEVDIQTVDRLTLADFGAGLPRAGQWRQGFDVADMNGDGHLDIVFGPARKARRTLPNIFLGDSQGHWSLWREARYAPLPYDYGDAAAGDLNGDGHPDLVLGVHLRGLLVLIGDGQGSFTAWTRGIDLEHPGHGGGATTFASQAVDLFDWDGDGRLDILALGEGPSARRTEATDEIFGEVVNVSRGLMAFLNQGDGTWLPQTTADQTVMSVQFGDDFALADFNRDGRVDVALASRMRNNRSILGIQTEEGLWTSRSLDELRPRTFVNAVEAADTDGDGVSELFVGYQTFEDDRTWRTGIDVFTPARDLSWKRRTIYVSEGQRPITSLALGELDGDGHPDLVALTGDAESWLFLGDGHGGFVREASPELLPEPEAGCGGFGLRLRDLDGDGRDEIVVGFAGEPSGFPGMAELSQPGCQNGGSLRVWTPHLAPRTEPAPEPAAGSR